MAEEPMLVAFGGGIIVRYDGNISGIESMF